MGFFSKLKGALNKADASVHDLRKDIENRRKQHYTYQSNRLAAQLEHSKTEAKLMREKAIIEKYRAQINKSRGSSGVPGIFGAITGQAPQKKQQRQPTFLEMMAGQQAPTYQMPKHHKKTKLRWVRVRY